MSFFSSGRTGFASTICLYRGVTCFGALRETVSRNHQCDGGPSVHPALLQLTSAIHKKKSADALRLFEKAAENTAALEILEDLDRTFPTEAKRTQERR